jgi:hypothetical protein
MLAADPRIERMISPSDFSIFHFNSPCHRANNTARCYLQVSCWKRRQTGAMARTGFTPPKLTVFTSSWAAPNRAYLQCVLNDDLGRVVTP